jgi:uncharacterized protein (DUF2147 family)
MKTNVKISKFIIIFITMIFATGITYGAKSDSPTGFWRTIDDETQEPKSIVELQKNNMGEITGKVIKILKTDDGSDPRTKKCINCQGVRQNQLIEGMTILWGAKKNGDEWTGGEILDPKTGSIYNVKFYLNEDGSKLNVRGFIGIALLGRTQVWERVIVDKF